MRLCAAGFTSSQRNPRYCESAVGRSIMTKIAGVMKRILVWSPGACDGLSGAGPENPYRDRCRRGRWDKRSERAVTTWTTSLHGFTAASDRRGQCGGGGRALSAGASESVIWDGHDGSRTLSIDEIHHKAKLIQGRPTPANYYLSE